jgi:hypothetical protein
MTGTRSGFDMKLIFKFFLMYNNLPEIVDFDREEALPLLVLQ